MMLKFTRQTSESITTARVYNSFLLHLSYRLPLSCRNFRPGLYSIIPIYSPCTTRFPLPRNDTCPSSSSNISSSKRSTGFDFHTDSRESRFGHCCSARMYDKQWSWHPSTQPEPFERPRKGKNLFCESAIFARRYYDARPWSISHFSLGSVLKTNTLYSGAHR